jgi:hypothetical protein
MNFYEEDLAELLAQVAELVAASPPEIVRYRDGGSIRVARDDLAAAIRSAYLTIVTAASPAKQDDAEPAGPTITLLQAMRTVAPIAGPADRRGPRAPRGYRGRWQAAAAAATVLEGHHGVLRELPGTAAWAAVRDLALLAEAFTYADDSLASAMPQVAELQRTGAHRRDLRYAATYVRLLASAIIEDRIEDLPGHFPLARPIPITSPNDIPDGLARLTSMLKACEGDVAVIDIDLVARVLHSGASWLASNLEALAQRHPVANGHLTASAHAAKAMHQPLIDLLRLRPRYQTLAATSFAIQLQCSDLVRALDQPWSEVVGKHRTIAVFKVARHLKHLGREFAYGVANAAMAGRLLVPTDHPDPDSPHRTFWQQAPVFRDPILTRISGLVTAVAGHAERSADRADIAAARFSLVPEMPALNRATTAAARLLGVIAQRPLFVREDLPEHPAATRRPDPRPSRRRSR